MRMALAGHQFPRAFAVTFGTSAVHETAVVEEEPQHIQVRVAQVATEGEVGAQPSVVHGPGGGAEAQGDVGGSPGATHVGRFYQLIA